MHTLSAHRSKRTSMAQLLHSTARTHSQMAVHLAPGRQHCPKGMQRVCMPGAVLQCSRCAARCRQQLSIQAIAARHMPQPSVQASAARRRQQLSIQRPATGDAEMLSLAQRTVAGLVALTTSSLLMCGVALADATVTENFTNKCMGCHYNGGNVVAAGATLFPEDLKRNGVADFDSIYNLVYSGKGKMPGFGTDCKPKGKCTFGPRLSDGEIRDLTQFTLDRAEAGWK